MGLSRATPLSALLLSACVAGGGGPLRASAPEAPAQLAKCHVAASQENPLVTEWPAPEKANLEGLLRQGAVVVAYSGCSLKLLPECRVAGAYAWRRTTTSTDVLEIHDADELYAKLPLGAVTLEGELQRSGRIAMQTTVSGQLQLAAFDPASLAQDPRCVGATHVVGALSVGAFTLRSGGTLSASGGASVPVVGAAQAGTSSSESVVRQAGDIAACAQASEAAPDPQCASPIQVYLRALPNTIVDRAPPGMVKARFLPVSATQQWDIVVGDRTLCTTPCERWVDPGMPFTFKYDPGFLYRNELIDVPDLAASGAGDHIEVKAEPRRTAEFVGGIVATTFSGAAVLTGTALTAVGCGEGGKTCTAGLVTLPLGAAALVPSIWLILDSAPRVQLRPFAPGSTLGQLPPASER